MSNNNRTCKQCSKGFNDMYREKALRECPFCDECIEPECLWEGTCLDIC